VEGSEQNDPHKKKYFMQKSNAVYTLILFYFKVIKHVINIFFISSKKNQNNLKKQVAIMQPLYTFPSKGSKSTFNLKKIREKLYKQNLYLYAE
jgi:mRNA degradation ribonuclease J1/J2